LFILSVTYLLLNAASYDKDASRPCAGHVLGFMSIGVVVTKNNDIFQKCVQVRLHFCSDDLRSVGDTVGSILYQPAGWLAGCSSMGRYSDVAGVLIWLPNVGRRPKRACCSCPVFHKINL